jgi:hypothetical protein
MRWVGGISGTVPLFPFVPYPYLIAPPSFKPSKGEF